MYLFFSSMNMKKEIIINMSSIFFYVYNQGKRKVLLGDVFILLRTLGTWCTSAPSGQNLYYINEKILLTNFYFFTCFFHFSEYFFASEKIISPQIKGTCKDYAD